MEKTSIVEERLRWLERLLNTQEARIKDLDGQLLATKRAIALTEDELARPSRLEAVTFSELEGCEEDGLFCRLPKFLEENGDYFVQQRVSDRSGFERRVALNGGMPC